MPPEVGDRAPDFETLLCDGETFRVTSFDDVCRETETGGAVLVFSAFAFSAIAENWWKRYERAGWAEFDAPVVGVSRDGPYAQNAFLRYLESPFRLYADTDAVAGEAFDLLTERHGMDGVTTPIRATFVVDGDREVRYRWVADDWISPAPREEVAEAAESLTR
ncbi:redoxin domain-containing protein [Halomarina oriensis]|uniref:Redoxin domain-containing protein n=1 Tax=Halomarina oriensis TaxID=671145 RepID=A0A6B0GPN3_9EURY|nr:redoxin domain-containing protein [Halomarina oriensis]MWG33588.1 redoxin domain-containing protein [Halomarina oriensis]